MEMGLTNSFKGGDKHDPFLLTFTITLHTLLDPPGSLRKLFQKLVRKGVLDDSPASDLSEFVDNDSLRLYLDPNDVLGREWQMLKGKQERPLALFRQRSCGGVYFSSRSRLIAFTPAI